MTEELYSDRNAIHLLKQLEYILERDTLIDEVGFIHPSQFAALNNGIIGSSEPQVDSVPQSVADVVGTNLSDFTFSQHDSTIFWNKDHKLAISTQALFPLYNAAKHAFMTALEQYKLLIKLSEETNIFLDEMVPDSITISKDFHSNEMMKHSRALLLLSCDYGTAWNARKIVTSKKQNFSFLMDELLLSALILSYSPKSEHTWSHRRWVIKSIDGKYSNIQDIVERESELVEKIAEKSKMNYRAWSHRCWLITYMTREQVLNELRKSRKWAELHVGDNSCFHYRQQLLNSLLEHSCSKLDSSESSYGMPDVYHVWMEEFDWDEMLIKRYIGREGLWIHRRFLSQFGIKHLYSNAEGGGDEDDMDNFINSELQLLQSCLSISGNEFENNQAQGVLAASYILWVSKHLPYSQVVRFQDKLRGIGELKTILVKLCPEKTPLWDGLFG